MANTKGIFTGIAIGDERLYLVRLKSVGGEPRLITSLAENLPGGFVHDGLIKDEKGFTAFLKDLCSKNAITPKDSAVCVLGANYIFREIKLPAMSQSQITSVLRGEVDKLMLSGEQPVFDHFPGSDGKIFLSALRKDIVNAAVSAVDKAGFNVRYVDVPCLAVLRALSAGNIRPDQEGAVIHTLIGPAGIQINVIKDGVPFYSRDISAANIGEMSKEIDFTRGYWEEEFPEVPVKKVVISGDDAIAKNLNLELSRTFTVVEQGAPLGMVVTEDNLSRSAVIGAAMRCGLTRNPFDINLLPPEKTKRMRNEKLAITLFASVSGILTLFFGIVLAMSAVTGSIRNNIERLKEEITLAPDVLGEVEELNKERIDILNMLNRRKEYLKKVETMRWAAMLKYIGNSIPSDLWLTRITTAEGQEGDVVLIGKAFSPESVYQYLNLLGSSWDFRDPKLASIKEAEEEASTVFLFTINFTPEKGTAEK